MADLDSQLLADGDSVDFEGTRAEQAYTGLCHRSSAIMSRVSIDKVYTGGTDLAG